MVSKGHESVNEFSSALWSDLDTAIAAAIQRNGTTGTRPVAAFDADGIRRGLNEFAEAVIAKV